MPGPMTFPLGGQVTVQRMGLGTLPLVEPSSNRVRPEREAAISVLRTAVEAGVTLIDTADAYGHGAAEELLREALWPYPDDVVIATKGGMTRDPSDDWRPCGTPEYLRQACERSLQRLGIDTIPLYQLHAPDPVVPFAEQVGALKNLQDEGKVAMIGLSNVSSAQIESAREVTEIVSVQNGYSIRQPDCDALIDELSAAGIAFIPWFPLQAGGIADGTAGPLSGLARREGISRAQLALAWLLARSPNVVPIPGTTSSTHLLENLAALERTLSPGTLQFLDRLSRVNQER